MQVICTPSEMQQQCERWRCAGKTVGFVPTMGALHEGHLALVRRARAENTRVVASIFVNPTQFRPGEDFSKYPRPFERDRELLQSNDCDVVFNPETEAMYPSRAVTTVSVPDLSARWEGAARPGHFDGVATVVAKLLNIVRAHRAYFGEKDFQQLQVITAMTRDLNFETQIVPCATVREEDGLALSSRNVYLSADERTAAPAIYKALCAAQKLTRAGERSVAALEAAMREALQRQPVLQQEYAVIVESETLVPLEALAKEKPARALIAARAGSTRLIDNAPIELH